LPNDESEVTARLSAARAKAEPELPPSLPRLARYDRVTPLSASWPLMEPQGAEATALGNRSRSRLAVTITPYSGKRFGAALVSAEGGVPIYERWDEVAGLPSGEPATVEVEEIAEVRVK